MSKKLPIWLVGLDGHRYHVKKDFAGANYIVDRALNKNFYVGVAENLKVGKQLDGRDFGYDLYTVTRNDMIGRLPVWIEGRAWLDDCRAHCYQLSADGDAYWIDEFGDASSRLWIEDYRKMPVGHRFESARTGRVYTVTRNDLFEGTVTLDVSDSVSRLIGALCAAADEATSRYLFKRNAETDLAGVQHMVEAYLKPLAAELFGSTPSVTCRHATWEENYPCMAERVLAIEAAERFGSTFVGETLPAEMQAYPYRRHVSTLLRFKDDDCTYSEYYDGSDGGFNLYQIIDAMKSPSFLSDEEIVSWRIDDPTGVVIVDSYVKPARTVEYFTINIQGMQA